MKKTKKGRFDLPKEVKNISLMIFVVITSLCIWLVFSEKLFIEDLKKPFSFTGYFITEFAHVFSNSPQIVFITIIVAVVALLWIFSKKN